MRNLTFMGADPESWAQNFRFSFPIRIRYSETDLLGHVNNVSYFLYFEQGRIEYFDRLAVTEELFGEKAVTVVASLECQYLEPLYLRDRLQLAVRAARLGRASLDIEYALLVDGRLKAGGRGTIVLVDRATGASKPLPERVRAAIRSFEGAALAE